MERTREEAKEPEVKVYDRRRFDADGNPRPDEPEEAATQSQQQQEPAAEVGKELEQLRSELDASRRRVDELARAYQTLDRDREEFKLRLNRERERLIEVERGNVALSLLEAIDELDLSLKVSADDQSPLAKGVRLIRDNMLRRVEAAGIERVSTVGQPFDPNVAEAADMEITAEADDDGKVVAEMRVGYRLKDRVIRPARVKVAKYVKPANA